MSSLCFYGTKRIHWSLSSPQIKFSQYWKHDTILRFAVSSSRHTRSSVAVVPFLQKLHFHSSHHQYSTDLLTYHTNTIHKYNHYHHHHHHHHHDDGKYHCGMIKKKNGVVVAGGSSSSYSSSTYNNKVTSSCGQLSSTFTTIIHHDNDDDEDDEWMQNDEEQDEDENDGMLLKVCILGPPNAGKSTLFNRLLDKRFHYQLSSEKKKKKNNKNNKTRKKKQDKKHQAIVSSTPGTTRDRREGLARIGSVSFQILDTAGIDKSSLQKHQQQQKQKKQKANRCSNKQLTTKKGAHDDNNKDDVDLKEELLANMVQQSIKAIEESDVILLVFDARYSNMYIDLQDILPILRRQCSKLLSSSNKPIFILANKLEGDGWSNNPDTLESIHQVQQYLGTNHDDTQVLIISAEHGDGMAELATHLQTLSRKEHKQQQQQQQQQQQSLREKSHDDDDDETQSFLEDDGTVLYNHNDDDGGDSGRMIPKKKKKEKPIPVAIVGRPNVGKSTLMNALLGEQRVIASAMPGTTRDAISILWKWNGHPIQLVDTAGLTKFHALSPHPKKKGASASSNNKSEDNNSQIGIDDASIQNALRAIDLAHVVILVIDVSETMFRRFELTLAQRAVIEEGRSLIICANKMDLITHEEYTHHDLVRDVQNQLGDAFPALRNTPVIATSSLYQPSHQIRDELLMPQIIQTRQRWSNTIPTATLNRWLRHAMDIQTPPTKIKYVIQTKGRPPTFLFFGNFQKSTAGGGLPMSYVKYLQRSLQENFDFHGMSLRLVMKSSYNADNNDRITPNLRKKHNTLLKGIGGRQGRQKRMVAALKQTGSTPHNLRKKLQRQRRSKQQPRR